jgi:sugar phosphate isomerase/epimerase
MKKFTSITKGVLFLMIFFSCSPEKERPDNVNLFSKDNLVAWCVVPFDSVKRTPAERARMLSELGFKQFAYDWRPEHLPTFADEIKMLKENNIKLKSVWLWVDTDSGEIFDDNNRELLRTIKENDVKTDFWLGFSNKHFDGLTDEQKLEKAVASVGYIRDEAKKLGCTVSLYNHGDWFGEPVNQVRIIDKMGVDDVSIVYNFHHAHLQVQEFPDLLQKMLPYLNTVNLNGMKVEGPKILTIGDGDKELEMLKTLKQSGYKGSIGIICHIETEDAQVVLKRNLEGLQTLLSKMGEKAALGTY